MAILRIKDESGNVISIPSIKGDKGDTGKSAYEYAQDGGYTGTEEEFAQKMTKEIPTKLSQLFEDETHRVVTDSEKATWNNKAGKYVENTIDAEIFNYDENIATGNFSHAEGYNTSAIGQAAHAEGAEYEGIKTIASGQASHSEGAGTQTISDASHSEGSLTKTGRYNTQEEALAVNFNGYPNIVQDALDLGLITEADVPNLTEEIVAGLIIKLMGFAAHAEGSQTKALGSSSHAEGNATIAHVNASHAEGDSTIAWGEASHAEGYSTTAEGNQSHAEGKETYAKGNAAHAEGKGCQANGYASHAEGSDAVADGIFSHAEGASTIAKSDYQHVQGKYNVQDSANKYAHIVGWGESNNSRKNIHTLGKDGKAWFADDVYVKGSEQSKGKKLATEEYVNQNVGGGVGESGAGEGAEVFNDYSGNTAEGLYSHSEGQGTQSGGVASHAEGYETQARGNMGYYVQGVNWDSRYEDDYNAFYISEKPVSFSHYLRAGQPDTSFVNIPNFVYSRDFNNENGEYEGPEYILGTVYKLSSNVKYYLKLRHIANNEFEILNGWGGMYDPEYGDISLSGTVFITFVNNAGTQCDANYCHAEGCQTKSLGEASHAEGNNTEASGMYSHSEGNATKATGNSSHSEGNSTKATGNCSHSEGTATKATGNSSHSEGSNTEASGVCSHSEGYKTIASGSYSHAGGDRCTSLGENALSYGERSISGGQSSIALGRYNTSGYNGLRVFPIGHLYRYAIGLSMYDDTDKNFNYTNMTRTASSYINVQESFDTGLPCDGRELNFNLLDHNGNVVYTGVGTTVNSATANNGIDLDSAVDFRDLIVSLNETYGWNEYKLYFVATDYPGVGSYSIYNLREYDDNGDELYNSSIEISKIFEASYAEGMNTYSCNDASHAEGMRSTASGVASHAEGIHTVAQDNQHAQGHYNDTSLSAPNSVTGVSTGTAFVIGNGTNTAKSNALRVTGEGAVYAKSNYNSTGADYAEFAEWADGNTNSEDRRGHFVTFDEDKPEMIRIANAGEYILGVVSGNPCVIGNSDESWMNKYIFDDFGCILYEDFEYEVVVGYKEVDVEKQVPIESSEEFEIVVEKQKVPITETRIGQRYQINPEYDPNREYIHRKDRPEWDYVGWIGVLSVRDDGTCVPGQYCKVADGGVATAAQRNEEVDTYRVINRVSDNIVKVALK